MSVPYVLEILVARVAETSTSATRNEPTKPTSGRLVSSHTGEDNCKFL